MSKPHRVYRCYDADDTLIYVGATCLTLDKRMAVHAKKNPEVVRQSARVEVTEYPDRDSALEAESRAIDTEHPTLNIRRGKAYEPTWGELVAAASRIPGANGELGGL